MVLPFDIDSSERLIDFMSDSQLPPTYGQRGGLNLIRYLSLLENFQLLFGLRCLIFIYVPSLLWQSLYHCLISLYLRGLF